MTLNVEAYFYKSKPQDNLSKYPREENKVSQKDEMLGRSLKI